MTGRFTDPNNNELSVELTGKQIDIYDKQKTVPLCIA